MVICDCRAFLRTVQVCMATFRKDMLVFGYMRKYCKKVNIEFPDDLIQLFSSWVMLMDIFDKHKCHTLIDFVTETKAIVKRMGSHYKSIFGTIIVQKGQKQSWKLKCSSCTTLIGIIDNDMLTSNDNDNDIDDFTDSKYKGWALSLGLMRKFHASDSAADDDGEFEYGEQFQMFGSNEIILTMELDLTQEKHDNGILSFTFHMPREDGSVISNNISNIAWDDIDVNKVYRAAICLTGSTGISAEIIDD